LQDFAKAGADMFTFHLEAVADPAQLSPTEAHPAVVEAAQQVRAAGMKVGVALKPATPAELLLPYLQQGLLDMVRCCHQWYCMRSCGGCSSGIRSFCL
jgi:ribulose-phosphate 3-epimerase